MSAAPTPTITDEEFTGLYTWAMKYADGISRRRRELEDVVTDAATDGLIWSRNNWHPERGEFTRFAKRAVRVAVERHISKHLARVRRRPTMLSLDTPRDGDDGHGEHQGWLAHSNRDRGPKNDARLPPEFDHLPDEDRFILRLFYIDRFTIRDIALLVGLPHEGVRQRILKIGRSLADGAAAPTRATGAKRLARDG